MSDLSRQDVVSALGPVHANVVSEIIGLGIDPVEFAEARVWHVQNKALMENGSSPRHPAGPVGEAIAILERLDLEQQDQSCEASPDDRFDWAVN